MDQLREGKEGEGGEEMRYGRFHPAIGEGARSRPLGSSDT